METIKVELTPEAQAILKNLKALPTTALEAMAEATDTENEQTVAHIKLDYLSFPKHEPAVAIGLRVRTNRYRQSLDRNKARIDGQTIYSAIGSNVKNNGVSYPAIHEFGATIPPHKITAAPGKKLKFKIGGRVMYRASVNHPGSTLPARRPIQRGITDRLTDYQNALSAAVLSAMQGP
jgi:hypothetical protein